jgi:protein-disulfide isomerase
MTRRWILVTILAAAMGWCPPASADVVGEGVDTVRCTETADIELPRKLELVQTILSDHFSELGRVGLVVNLAYDEAEVSKGKVIATAVQIKPDESEIALGKVVARVRNGESEKIKIVAAVIEPGDRIRWRLKLKKLPRLEADLEDCWSLNVAIYVADEVSM